MARKMKKFAAGGRAERGQDRYDRMIADIEKDYQKAQGRKSGRGLEVARAKYEQRMADAKDDLAKARGEDRTASRAAERAAERELTMTRRFGARKVPALEDTGPLVRPSVHDDLKTPMPSLKPSAPTRRAAAPTPQRRAATPAPRRETPTPQRRETPAPTGIPASIARMGIKDYLPAKQSQRAASRTTEAPPARARTLSQQYLDFAAARERQARGKRAAESAPTGINVGAKLKNMLGLGSSGDTRLAQTYRGLARQASAQEAARARIAAERKAADEEELRANRAKARAGNPFYQSYLDKAKGGSVKGYAKGGKIDGCAKRGLTKAKRK